MKTDTEFLSGLNLDDKLRSLDSYDKRFLVNEVDSLKDNLLYIIKSFIEYLDNISFNHLYDMEKGKEISRIYMETYNELCVRGSYELKPHSIIGRVASFETLLKNTYNICSAAFHIAMNTNIKSFNAKKSKVKENVNKQASMIRMDINSLNSKIDTFVLKLDDALIEEGETKYFDLFNSKRITIETTGDVKSELQKLEEDMHNLANELRALYYAMCICSADVRLLETL